MAKTRGSFYARIIQIVNPLFPGLPVEFCKSRVEFVTLTASKSKRERARGTSIKDSWLIQEETWGERAPE